MKHELKRVFMLLSVLSLALSSPAFSQAPPTSTKTSFQRFHYVPPTIKKGGEVRWTVAKGGRLESEKDEYTIAEGGVKIEYQDITLQSDKLTYNAKTKDTVAEGHVIIDQGQTRIAATQGVFNLDSKTGTFFNAQASLDSSLYFTGERIEKINEDTYRLENGVFTSCDLDRPAWSFHIRRADITLDSYAHMKDVSFRAGGVPIFWTPRLLWPTKRDRSQGLLIPRLFLSNNELGERIELGYFLPFGDAVDTTIYSDLSTKGYYGGGIDLRYLPSQDVKLGNLSVYAVRDVDPNLDGIRKAGESNVQWKYQYQHSQDNLPGGFRGVVDMQDYSDLDFFRKWDHDPRLTTLSNIYSSAYLTKNRPTYSFNLLSDRREIFLGHVNPNDPSSDTIRQRYEQLPSLQFRMYPQRLLGTPLYFSLESSASHLVTNGLVNGPSANYYREDIFPTLSLQLRTPAWLSVRPQISARGTHYSASIDPDTLQLPGSLQKTVDEPLSRYYAQGQVEIVGPSVSRVFNKSVGGFARFKHVVEPRVRYIYTSNVEDQERVIRFDTVDSPFLPIVRDSVEYSLTQRLIGKGTGENASPREVASFTLRQTVSLSKPFTNTTGGNLPGSSFDPTGGQKFTPLTANLHVNPYQSITLDANATMSNVSHQLSQTSLSANLLGTGRYADKYLGFTWFATFRQPQQTSGQSSQVRLNTGSSFINNKLRLDAQVAFDAQTGEFQEQRYLVGGTGSCYGLAVEFRRYIVFAPFRRMQSGLGLAVTLKNVGTIGTH